MIWLACLLLAADPPQHWAFTKPIRPPVPKLAGEQPRNPIDAFVDAKLEAAKIAPAAEADRPTLLRRLSFDLTGLPPTPAELDEFEADDSAGAWDVQVDRLLASPQFGERWARHWLDLVRFSESDGYRFDRERLDAYRYRDYVIRSFNDDKPYDRFVMEQLAGDELWPDKLDAVVATGFYRHYPEEEVDAYLHSKRQILLNDVTDTFGAAFLGLTVGCARCHDHKFDPFPQEDYYRLQAFFAGYKPIDPPRTQFPHTAKAATQLHAWEQRVEPIKAQLWKLERPTREMFQRMIMVRFPPEVREALNRSADACSPLDQFIVAYAPRQMDISAEKLTIAMEKIAAWKPAFRSMKELERVRPELTGAVMAATDVGPEAPPTFVLKGGVFGAAGKEVAPGYPSALGSGDPTIKPSKASSGRRTALAKWLVQADQALTARVIVNRLWQHHFGRGLVATPSDFGVQGEAPSHPELLDWLACETMSQKWRLKAIHRLIVTSKAYRRKCLDTPEGRKLDFDNKLLWRAPRRRVDAESLRDAMLAVSGVLNPTMYGPGIFPPLLEEAPGADQWPSTVRPIESFRRSIYIFARRNLKYPLLDAFDLPDPTTPCACRPQTNTAGQALHLWNGRITLDLARRLAGRAIKEESSGKRVRLVYRLCFAREATKAEVAAAKQFLVDEARILSERETAAGLAGPIGGRGADVTPTDAAAFVDFCHVMMNSNEFLYID